MTNPAPRRFLDPKTPPSVLTLTLLAGISALTMNIFLPSLPSMAAWFDARQSAKAECMNQYRASIGGQTLADLADAIRAAGTLTDDQAAAVWRGLADVAKALRKAGHPKPKRERPAPVALPGQADLLADAAEPAPAVLPPASTGV